MKTAGTRPFIMKLHQEYDWCAEIILKTETCTIDCHFFESRQELRQLNLIRDFC